MSGEKLCIQLNLNNPLYSKDYIYIFVKTFTNWLLKLFRPNCFNIKRVSDLDLVAKYAVECFLLKWDTVYPAAEITDRRNQNKIEK